MGAWYTLETTVGTPISAVAATGLHLCGTATTLMFDDIRVEGRRLPFIAIGRGATCHIRIRNDRSVSGLHAILERHENNRWSIHDESTNGVFINGKALAESQPSPLLAGMRLRIGKDTHYAAVDDTQLVLLFAHTVDEFCRLAIDMYGSAAEAARRYGLGREFIRTHAHDWQRQGRRP